MNYQKSYSIVVGPQESGRIAEGRVCKGENWLNIWEVGEGIDQLKLWGKGAKVRNPYAGCS